MPERRLHSTSHMRLVTKFPMIKIFLITYISGKVERKGRHSFIIRKNLKKIEFYRLDTIHHIISTIFIVILIHYVMKSKHITKTLTSPPFLITNILILFFVYSKISFIFITKKYVYVEQKSTRFSGKKKTI